jgi:hypothetical protein
MVVNVRILFVCNDRQQLLEPLASLRWHNPALSQMRPQSYQCLVGAAELKIGRPDH